LLQSGRDLLPKIVYDELLVCWVEPES